MEQGRREQAIKFIEDFASPAWHLSRDQVMWAIRIALVLVMLLGALTLIGLPFGITLWAWVKLLIVPVVLAIGGYLFTRSENRATQAAAERRAQDEALQAYLDHIGQQLLDKDSQLLVPQDEEREEFFDAGRYAARSLIRARTLTVLTRLDGKRKGSVVRFLYESGLIQKGVRVIDLRGADLSLTDLGGITQYSARLTGTYPYRANLSRAHLVETNLYRADLRVADLSEANLTGANLNEANLSHADLRWANLSHAHLVGANLSGTNLDEANLSDADLRGADLHDAFGNIDEMLGEQGFSPLLEDATMPNGQKYEDWLKDKTAREDEG